MIAKVFQSGNSQAVRLPKEFRLDCSEVEIYRRGEEIVLRVPQKGMEAVFDCLIALPDDFPDHIEDFPPQERQW